MASPTADLPAFPVPRTDPLGIPPEYTALREERPVTRVRLEDGGEAWLVTGYRQAREVLGSRRFSSDTEKPGFPQPARFRQARARESLNRTLIRMDPPEHTRYRRMMSPEFVIQRMEAMRPRIQEIADGLLDELARRPPPADLVDAFALPLPSLVICEVLGVPAPERPRFERMARTLVTTPSSPTSSDRFAGIVRELRLYMEDLVVRKNAEPGDDLLSHMIEWEAAGQLTHDELVDMGRLLLLAGHVTTANMIGLGVVLLLRHPAALAELRADPALAAGAVEEVLRHQTLLQGGLRRVAVEDAEIGGQLIRAGEGVIVLIAAANRDAALGDGDVFDIHRGVRHHLAFGYGFHQCLGQLLARVELQVALVSVAGRFPRLALAVPPGQVAMREDGFLHGVRELPVTW
jgi:cytochrome P450